jgi:phosphoadenosine phosphosulfate reductase
MSNTSLAPTLATPLGTTLAISPAPASPSTGTDQHAVAVAVRARAALSVAELAELNRRFESASPRRIVEWASDRFGRRLAMTASFADTMLIDLATRVDPDIEVIFFDTGFHFPETLNTVRRAMERYALNLTVLRPGADAPDVWADGSDACCAARKVDPLDAHLPRHADAWLSGLRRADSPARADTPIVSIDRRGLVKVNPIATMTDDEYEAYIAEHDVLVNTLALDGYASIGCWPCTEPSTDGRAGRWGGSKTECGLHL